ncbi:hypothetical protein D3C87_1400070 [compost metagenome]
MTDHTEAAHVLGAFGTDMPDVVEERGQHHFIIETFGHGQFGSLGHVFDLRHGFADVIVGAEAFV